jgi:hypothetical protein
MIFEKTLKLLPAILARVGLAQARNAGGIG